METPRQELNHIRMRAMLKPEPSSKSETQTPPMTLEAPNMAQKRTLRRSASVTGCGNILHILFVDFFFVFLNEYDIIINTGSIRH